MPDVSFEETYSEEIDENEVGVKPRFVIRVL